MLIRSCVEKIVSMTLICNYDDATLYDLELDTSNLIIKDIPLNIEWALFVAFNRGRLTKDVSPELYEKYLDQYQTNQFFKEYQNYIYTQRSQDALLDLTEDERENFIKIQDSLNRNKRNQLALLFNILGGAAFMPIDFTDNLPQLTMWINNNKEKPIEPLTDDECKIIAVLMGGYYEKILSFNVLSNSIKTYEDVNEVIKNIPVKFGVSNITQVLFRIYLLKPHIWNNREFEELIKSIKNVREAV